MEFNLKKGDFSQLGVTKGKNWVNFCFVCRKEVACKVLIYDRSTEYPFKEITEITIPEEFSMGNLRAIRMEGLCLTNFDYNFWIDGKVVLDPYARRVVGREVWADNRRNCSDAHSLRCRCEEKHFSWKGDVLPEIPRKDMVLYKLHVRGFTKGLSQNTSKNGTFRSLMKKLSYLQGIGITTIELMPIYEFEEFLISEPDDSADYRFWEERAGDSIRPCPKESTYKINYWGYGEGAYFAPKASYAEGEHPDIELKECILAMHKKGMECIMEIDFPDSVPIDRIPEVLEYWVREYHVDGFHLQGNRIPMEMLIRNPYLGRTKLFYRNIPPDAVSTEEEVYPRIFLDTDEFMYPCRKLVSSINGNVWELADQMKKQNKCLGYINYIADNNGFTLADLFTYERKRNEANGENNADGPEWNFGNNCGVEGETTSRNVLKVRERRMKNAIAILFLAQGVPMLMAGDEDCNSQKGNNNVYCQDNELGWKDWKQTKAAKEFLKFVKGMIAFRKEHEILRQEQAMQLVDTLGCGYPDLSYHEENAWISQQFFNRRALGILYCGKYAKETEDVYVGLNFSDFPKKLALPKQRGKRHWYLKMDTSAKNGFLTEETNIEEVWYSLEAQSVCIIIGR